MRLLQGLDRFYTLVVGAVFVWVVVPVVLLIATKNTAVEMTAHLDEGPALSGDVSAVGPWLVPVTLDDLDLGQRLLQAGPMALRGGAILVALWLVGWLITDVRAGRPFLPANARRLTWTAVLVAIVPPLSVLQDVVDYHLLRQSDIADDVTFVLGIPWWPFALAAVIGVLAAAFRQGSRMQTELAGLV